jgi:hypothetical protein
MAYCRAPSDSSCTGGFAAVQLRGKKVRVYWEGDREALSIRCIETSILATTT